MTPAQTIIKANSVPMDVMCPNLEIGKNPAKKLTKTMKSRFDRHGVRHWGWMSEKSFGKSPSLDMAKKMRDWPKSITSITDVNPAMIPRLIKTFNPVYGVKLTAETTGAASPLINL